MFQVGGRYPSRPEQGVNLTFAHVPGVGSWLACNHQSTPGLAVTGGGSLLGVNPSVHTGGLIYKLNDLQSNRETKSFISINRNYVLISP